MRTYPVSFVGNAFRLVDCREVGQHDWPSVARDVCWGQDPNRAECDGLLVFDPTDAPHLRMFNPDGTEDFCGNGLLCAAAYAWQSGAVRERKFTIIHGGRQVDAELELEGDTVRRAAVMLPAPIFAADRIPVVYAHSANIPFRLDVDDVPYPLWPVSMGTAHAVIFTESEVSEEEFQKWSPLIENHPAFPERTTVDWVTSQGNGRASVRIWERGVGETLGCGTGAAAVAVTGFGRLHRGTLEVQSKGGVLRVNWPGHGPVRIGGTVSMPATESVPTSEENRPVG